MDGRRFLAESRDTFDVIVVDAFGSSAIPFHLVTEEAFALAASRLAPRGVLAINVETVGWADPIVAAFVKTLAASFEHVAVLPTAEPPNTLGNVIILASNRPIEIPDERLESPFELLAEPYRHWCAVQRNHAWDNRYTPDVRGARAFTDDLNDVDLMAERVNLAARRDLHARPELAGAGW
jgi:hypothetical protein